MRSLTAFAALAVVVALAMAAPVKWVFRAEAATPAPSASVAAFAEDGSLNIPDNLDKWVFLGSSLGMGYSQQNFDPNSPGMFQIVTMEPNAYREFMATGEFPEGAMFLLGFYGAENKISINRSGFVMGDAHSYEIHLKDRTRFPETGFNFYTFGPGDKTAAEVPLPNDCVACHTRDGAHDGVFTQFYPVARERLAKEKKNQADSPH